MARKHDFPVPEDRSVNNPSQILNSTKVLALYNQEHPKDKATYVADGVKTWTADKAGELGWSEATFHGNQCVLVAKIEVKK